MKQKVVTVCIAVAALVCEGESTLAQYAKKMLVAHRGASAYRPEHTLESYTLALEQGADFVEPDLQITKDGVLVCMHDVTLERTTDVEERFPGRAVVEGGARHWYVADFTLAEIKSLDAGSWFNAQYRGATVPTLQEMIDLVKGKAGIIPETKEPEVYGQRGFDMERLVLETLRKNDLDAPVIAGGKSAAIIQSFSAESLRRLKSYGARAPLMLLVSGESASVLSANSISAIRKYAEGIGPSKEILLDNPEIVRMAHNAGLSVTPYTFRDSGRSPRFASIREEMAYFLNQLGVDALFTDNPDQFPR
jgi:glycerophosphoryl diester phosphodiesterase